MLKTDTQSIIVSIRLKKICKQNLYKDSIQQLRIGVQQLKLGQRHKKNKNKGRLFITKSILKPNTSQLLGDSEDNYEKEASTYALMNKMLNWTEKTVKEDPKDITKQLEFPSKDTNKIENIIKNN